MQGFAIDQMFDFLNSTAPFVFPHRRMKSTMALAYGRKLGRLIVASVEPERRMFFKADVLKREHDADRFRFGENQETKR